MSKQFAGWRTEVHTEKYINVSTYLHPKLTDVILTVLGKEYLSDKGISLIELTPKFEEVKKSTVASVTPPVKVLDDMEEETIVTENGIKVTFKRNGGVAATNIGPL